MESDAFNTNEARPDSVSADILSDMPNYGEHMNKLQIAKKVDKIAQIQDDFPDAVVTFDNARQLLYYHYTGKTYDCDESEIGFVLPRYEIRQFERDLPDGYEVNYNDRSGSKKTGPTGREMLESNDILIKVKSDDSSAFSIDENVAFFGMGKDQGVENQDWMYIDVMGSSGELRKIKIETLPTHIDNTLFWSLYNTGGKVSEHSAREAQRILAMTQFLTEDEKRKLSDGFITENYIAKLEYLATGGNIDHPAFELHSSKEDLAAVKTNAESFLERQPEMEHRRLELLNELKTVVDQNSLSVSNDGVIIGLSDKTKAAIKGYEKQLVEAIEATRKTEVIDGSTTSGAEFIKHLMKNLSQDDIYRIVFRLIDDEPEEQTLETNSYTIAK